MKEGQARWVGSRGEGSEPQACLLCPCRGMGPPPESFLPPGEDEGEDEDESEEEMLSDASPWTYSSSSDKQVGAEGGH